MVRASPKKRIANFGSTFVYVTYIRTTPEKLWHALTTPEIIKQYRFGMSVESEWKVGSTWRMYADGSLMDSGEILESVSQKRLVKPTGFFVRCKTPAA